MDETTAQEPWIVEVAMPLLSDDGGETLRATCPFCDEQTVVSVTQPATAKRCAHYRRFHVAVNRAYVKGSVGEVYAVFEGTPRGYPHRYYIPREEKVDGNGIPSSRRCRILDARPGYFVIEVESGERLPVYPRQIGGGVHFKNGLILSSRNDPSLREAPLDKSLVEDYADSR